MERYHAKNLRLGRYSAENQIYLLTTATHDRNKIFTDFIFSRIVINQMRRLESEARLISLAFVLMPDHLHWLIVLRQPHKLDDVMRLLKGRTSRAINLNRRVHGSIWQAGYYDTALRHEENLKEAARYIIANPVRVGLVRSVREYSHWDAMWI